MREKDDYYATYPANLPALLRVLGFDDGRSRLIREPSCGEGHLSVPLELYGHQVVSTDLVDRGYGVAGIDFLQHTPQFDNVMYDAVIMNPPFKHAIEFLRKSLTQAPIVAAFLKMSFLESETRETFYEDTPARYVAYFSRRAKSAMNANWKIAKGETFYAWHIWHFGFKGRPELISIKPEENDHVRKALALLQKDDVTQ